MKSQAVTSIRTKKTALGCPPETGRLLSLSRIAGQVQDSKAVYSRAGIPVKGLYARDKKR